MGGVDGPWYAPYVYESGRVAGISAVHQAERNHNLPDDQVQLLLDALTSDTPVPQMEGVEDVAQTDDDGSSTSARTGSQPNTTSAGIGSQPNRAGIRIDPTLLLGAGAVLLAVIVWEVL